MSQNIKIRETIHHGDYYHTRDIEVYAITDMTVEGILMSSAYCYASGQVMLPRVVADLQRDGKAEFGWSNFEVI